MVSIVKHSVERTIVVDKIIRHTLCNIVVDGFYCDTEPRTIAVDELNRHILGNIVVDGIYCDTQPRTIYCCGQNN